MERYVGLRAFVASAREFLKSPNETTTSALQRNVLVLSSSPEPAVFAPGTHVASDFYEALYALLAAVTPSVPVFWSLVDLLHRLAALPAAQAALTHTYKVSRILAPHLSASLIPEKRMRLLKLLRVLTTDIRIHWQESHLPGLVQTLVQWIAPSQDLDVVTNSLGLLINLCRRNPPAIYTIFEVANTKTFHKNLLRLQMNNSRVQLLCCKILLIMEETNHEIPELFVKNFVEIAFKIIDETLEQGNAALLADTVDFFEEIRCNEKTRNSLGNFDDYAKKLKKIVRKFSTENCEIAAKKRRVTENSSNSGTLTDESPGSCGQSEKSADSSPSNGATSTLYEIAEISSKFFTSLLKLKVAGIFQFHQDFVEISLKHLAEKISPSFLHLLKTVLVDSRRNKNFVELLADADVSFLISLINSAQIQRDNAAAVELIQLIQELNRIANYRGQISRDFSEPRVREMMQKVEEESPRDLTAAATSTYVNLICLISDLSTSDSKWLALYTESIKSRKIQMLIATSILASDLDTKSKTLSLISSVGFNQDCVAGVARWLTELSSPQLEPRGANFAEKSENFEKSKHAKFENLEKLDRLLDKFAEKVERNEIESAPVTEVIELYGYKLSGLRSAEENQREALAAAERSAAFLQRRIAHLEAEASRLHELLFSAEKNAEVLRSEGASLRQKLGEAEAISRKAHESQRLEIRGLKKIVAEKSKVIEEFAEVKRELDAAARKVRDLEVDRAALKRQSEEAAEKNLELVRSVNKLQESVAKREARIQEKNQEIDVVTEAVNALKQENEQLVRQCKSYEATIAEKDDSLKKQEVELASLSRMRDMIFQLTAHKDQNQTTTD